jgi:predicted metal-dependent HD superfamily phosphohydrolase
MLKHIFTTLVKQYSEDTVLTETLWLEIEKAYSGKKRFYHNLHHLENLYRELDACRKEVSDWDTVLFSLFYHDIVYKATAKDNEERSADAAVKVLKSIGYPDDKIAACHKQILATKSHIATGDNDTDLFTDADLSILGYPPEAYDTYTAQVRKEYAIYPDFLYKPGRYKVLEHFLATAPLFKTAFFRAKYEERALENISREMAQLKPAQ